MGARRAVAARERSEAAGGLRSPRSARPSRATLAGVAALQHTIGNAAVARLLARGAQPKLRVGAAGDQFEREADVVADAVMRARSAPPEIVPAEDDERHAPVRRAPRPESSVGLEGGDLEAGVEQDIRSASRSGSTLPGGIRRSMEGALGADLGGVRVHTGAEADSLNQHMQSRAFTLGRDIFFAKGQYRPGSPGGQHLLAHELTHTIQQTGLPPDRLEEQ